MSTSTSTRATRTAAIRAAAIVRRRLSQAAQHRLVDGRHEIIYRGVVFPGATLDAAIVAAGGEAT